MALGTKRTLLVTTEIVGSELHVANGELFRCCMRWTADEFEQFTWNEGMGILGWSVGCNVASRSFFNMCSKVCIT